MTKITNDEELLNPDKEKRKTSGTYKIIYSRKTEVQKI